jgi:probable rRNA maturation factor
MAVLISNTQNKHKMRLKKIQQAAQAVLDALDCPEAELSILMVDDAQIAVLNREYLRRHGPTNVIAFPMQAGEFSNLTPHLLGDVVIQ